ncbi:MAG: OprD family porin [Campylobacteraceae bacterium]|jgi:hypothetical protein|nr:OprD family porin [Campylobacteraceae bacterium]
MGKISMATVSILALSINTYAGGSLSDSLIGGNFTGELGSYYVYEKAGDKVADIMDFALRVNYTTGSYYGFKTSATAQLSYSAFIDKYEEKIFGAKNGWYGSGAVLSELYLSYKYSKTEIKAGRQFINMPLINGDRDKAVVQSFQGVTVVSSEVKDNIFYGAYIDGFQLQTDGKGGIGKFEKRIKQQFDGDWAYAIGIENSYFKKLIITGAYGAIYDVMSMIYTEVNYKNIFKNDSFDYNAALQYANTNYKNQNINDANYYGVKLGFGVNNLRVYAAYAQITDGTSGFGILGGGNKCVLFTSSLEKCALYDESRQYAVDANYNFKESYLAGVRYSSMDYAKTAESVDWTDVYIAYSPAKKNLFVSGVYERENHKPSKEIDTFMVRAKYNF